MWLVKVLFKKRYKARYIISNAFLDQKVKKVFQKKNPTQLNLSLWRWSNYTLFLTIKCNL
jgi:hypothetical protein